MGLPFFFAERQLHLLLFACRLHLPNCFTTCLKAHGVCRFALRFQRRMTLESRNVGDELYSDRPLAARNVTKGMAGDSASKQLEPTEMWE